ncbi:MAG TPA: hypothetical protein DCQ06_01395 [Myxococcales bacterium]|nr:hypothetical protein [Myxococcales bacterium]
MGHAGQIWLLLAALLFWLSDISVAIDRFAAGGYINRLWGLGFYYAAQFILAVLALCASTELT